MRYSDFRASLPDRQQLIRKAALAPSECRQPESYRIYTRCKEHNVLWWGGGMSSQPHLLMLEWDACRSGEAVAKMELVNVEKAIRKLK